MNKKIVVLVPIIIVCIIGIMFLYIIAGSEKRKIELYDYRMTYSDKYEITATEYFRIIDEIKEKMIPIDDGIVSEFRIGGFLLFEERNNSIIESYRVQGSIVTKFTYKNTYDNVLSTTYYNLDDKYFEELGKVCDRLREKK